MQKRSTVFWAITVAELALAIYAVTSFAWAQQDSADAESNLASTSQTRAARV